MPCEPFEPQCCGCLISRSRPSVLTRRMSRWLLGSRGRIAMDLDSTSSGSGIISIVTKRLRFNDSLFENQVTVEGRLAGSHHAEGLFSPLIERKSFHALDADRLASSSVELFLEVIPDRGRLLGLIDATHDGHR